MAQIIFHSSCITLNLKYICFNIWCFLVVSELVFVVIVSGGRSKSSAKPPENNILFEKVESQIIDKKICSFYIAEFRPIGHNLYKFNTTMTLVHPIDDVEVHFELYHKYNRYEKFLINLWEDGCLHGSGTFTSPMDKLIMDNIKRLGFEMTSDMRCPLHGTLSTTVDRFNASHLVIPLLPAGRYRLDFTFTEGKKRNVYVAVQGYFTVSDLRVWF